MNFRQPMKTQKLSRKNFLQSTVTTGALTVIGVASMEKAQKTIELLRKWGKL